jgi:hypothetical protein
LYWLKYARREQEMKGLTIELNEFVAAALLITLAVLGVGYWHTHRPVAQAPVPAPVVTCTSAAPNITIRPRIVVPKPKVIVIYPGTTVDVTPSDDQMKELQKGKVWDNDNMPSAQDPPTFDPNRHPVSTASLNK